MPEDKQRSSKPEKEDFANLTGYLRVLEKRVLSGDGIAKLFGITDFSEALKTLSQNTEYDFSQIPKPEDFGTVLNTGLKDLYDEFYVRCAEPLVLDIPAVKYDYHNVKVALKAKYLGGNHSSVYIRATRVEPEAVEKAANGAYGSVPAHISAACRAGEEAFLAKKNPQDIDVTLDRLMFGHALKLCGELRNNFITEYTRLSIDFHNIKTLLRIKDTQKDVRLLEKSLAEGGFIKTDGISACYDRPGTDLIGVLSASGEECYNKFFCERFKQALDAFGKTGNYSAMERFFDNALLSRVRESRYVAFGPEVMFAYILSKENELKQIRILMTCKLNGIRDDVARERLRDNYA